MLNRRVSVADGRLVCQAATLRTLFVVGSTGTIWDSLIEALHHEFSDVVARKAPSLRVVLNHGLGPAALLLVDPDMLSDLESWRHGLSDGTVAPAAAMMFDERIHSRRAIDRAFGSRAIRGVVPMNLRLDLWLAVISLLLRGGEYFPPWVFRTVEEHLEERVDLDARATARSGNTAFEELTDRELQVLELISCGHQNKIIAAKLGLSENTVKVHVHNIINKLGVHNRTSAASIFLGT